MSVASLDLKDLEDYVRSLKASWREVERNKTWEEKIEAIERMRERDREIAKTREQNEIALRKRLAAAPKSDT